MPDTAPKSLQETILACLVFDDKSGTTIAAQIAPEHFDETYREIAEKVLVYRRKYGRAPGVAHLDDLFDARLQEGNSRVRQTLLALSAIAPDINGEYAIARTGRFVREQQLKAALVEASARWEQGGDEVSLDIEAILHKALKNRANGFDAGTFLGDQDRALRFLDREGERGVPFGIKELDNRGMLLRPKEFTLYIGGKGTGKTWAAVQMGKQALILSKKVVHITCEVSEEIITARYFQSIFAAAHNDETFARTFFEYNDDEQLQGIRTKEEVKPTWHFAVSNARKLLREKMTPWGARFNNLVVKEFPSGSLTLSHLEAYLDYLEQEHKFHPALLIVDYPDIMAQDAKNYRISIGRTFVGLRGICVDRYISGFFPTQGNRRSLSASTVSSDMVAEDISKLHTADNVLIYSRTKAEKDRNLARLLVSNARNSRDGFTVVMTQSYDTGQFALQTAPLIQYYWDTIKTDEESDET